MNNKESLDPLHPALSALQRLLPACYCWGKSFSGALPDPRTIPRADRSKVFSSAQAMAGDECVMHLLRMAGLPIHPVANGEGGDRKWPKEFVGSLSYKESVVIGAFAKRSETKMLGLDLESLGTTSLAQIQETIAPEGLPKGPTEETAAHFAFAAKEAVFKAQYPDTKLLLNFSDVSLVWRTANDGGAQAVARCSNGVALSVRIAVEDRWVISVATEEIV